MWIELEFLFTDLIFLGYQMVRHFFDCLCVMFDNVHVWINIYCVTYEATYCVDQNIIMWLFFFFCMQRFKDLCRTGQSQSQRQKISFLPSRLLSLSRGLPLPHRGVKLTVTVISRFVGRTVSVPRLGQPVRCSSPFLASLSFSSLLFCEGYASHTTGDERTILNRISTLKWNHPAFMLAEMTELCFTRMI